MSKPYDATAKVLFNDIPKALIKLLTNQEAVRMESLEISAVKQRTPDLLLTLEDQTLLHIELQSSNDTTMPWRMLEYYSLIYQQFNQVPLQLVLYLGYAPLTMKATIQTEKLNFSYQVKDIREIDCQPLMSSDIIGDNLLSLLCKNGATVENLRKILQAIQKLPKAARQDALVQVLLLSQLRKVQVVLQQEIEKMPIQMDLREHPYFQEILKKEVQQAAIFAREEAELRGELRGKIEASRHMLSKLLSHRFGAIPDAIESKIAAAELEQLEVWIDRLLDTPSLAAIFE